MKAGKYVAAAWRRVQLFRQAQASVRDAILLRLLGGECNVEWLKQLLAASLGNRDGFWLNIQIDLHLMVLSTVGLVIRSRVPPWIFSDDIFGSTNLKLSETGMALAIEIRDRR